VAVAYNRQETVCVLLDGGADISRANRDRVTALQLACKLGFGEVARLLVERGADVTAKDNTRMTALHHATLRSDTGLVRLLIDHGADPLARNADGKSPFSLANAEIAEVLRGAIASLREAKVTVKAAREEEEEEEEVRTGEVADAPTKEIVREIVTPPRGSSSAGGSSGQKVVLDSRQKLEFEALKKEVQEELADIRAEFEVRMKGLMATLADVRRRVVAKKRKAAEPA
jgi:hypothetical protein